MDKIPNKMYLKIKTFSSVSKATLDSNVNKFIGSPDVSVCGLMNSAVCDTHGNITFIIHVKYVSVDVDPELVKQYWAET